MGLYWVSWEGYEEGECSTERSVPHIIIDEVFEVMGDEYVYPAPRGLEPLPEISEARESEIGSERPVNDGDSQ